MATTKLDLTNSNNIEQTVTATPTADAIPIADGSGKLESWLYQPFGGTGVDGALVITTGSSTIDLGGESVVIKNYSSISITGTGYLNFINPSTTGTIVMLKSQGDVTVTSSATMAINATNFGSAGGASITDTSSSVGATGTIAQTDLFSSNPGGAGQISGGGTAGAVGARATSYYAITGKYLKYAPYTFLGAGGGSGAISVGSGTFTSGVGGTGAGALIIETAGYLNFTGTISVAGGNGGDGVINSGTGGAGGGGGGSAGLFLCLYNNLTANSGTITKTGGIGGKTYFTAGYGIYGAPGGGNIISAGIAGTPPASTGDKTGGNGALGYSFIGLNTEF